MADSRKRSGSVKQGGERRRSGSETRKREPIIGFRANADERARIQANADRAGLTVSSYVRSRSLRKPTTRAVRRPPVETAQLAQLLGLLGAAGGELQRLAKAYSAEGPCPAEALGAALADFRAAASAILRALGKRA
jgi:hypothetical protein